MIIVRAQGGLGNQMYQYALYCALKAMGKDVKLDLNSYDYSRTHKTRIPEHGKNFLLAQIFGVEYDAASPKETYRLGNVRMDYFSRLLRKTGYAKKTHIKEDISHTYSAEWFEKLNNVYLDGYWQNFDYFANVQDKVRGYFTFPQELSEQNKQTLEHIRSSNSVSLHVRRGDYLALSAYAAQSQEYYTEAIKQIESKVNNPVYFCFSDDIEWCKNNLPVTNAVFVDWNKGKDSYIDMQLMSECKNNIITNSSFSMWGAWLNKNADKTVIRPKHYYTDPHKDAQVPWPKDWICIGE